MKNNFAPSNVEKFYSDFNLVNYTVILNKLPIDKKMFLKDINFTSISTSDFYEKKLPIKIYSKEILLKGEININNFPEPDKTNLQNLKNKYNQSIEIKLNIIKKRR